ncbi:MAG: hypothetical protein DME39_02365, partial [Verrucomicrobia bacterium]
FQIIFADPPYEKTKHGDSYTEKLVTNEVLPRLLDSSGVFVLEKRPAETLSEMQLWRLVRQKTYGTTEVLFLSAIRNRQLVRRSLGEGRSTIK